MATRTYRVYGEDGNRQRESFAPSFVVEASTDSVFENSRVGRVEEVD